MSRVAKRPVDLPQGVTASVAANTIKVKGAKGELSLVVADGVTVEQQDKKLQVKFASAGSRMSAGAARAYMRCSHKRAPVCSVIREMNRLALALTEGSM